MLRTVTAAAIILSAITCVPAADSETWPALPEQNAEVEIPAQEWPLHPGPRTVKFSIFYPGGSIEGVTPETGLFLTLHNWGGTKSSGTADPQTLVDRLNVIAMTVEYLQSNSRTETVEPYDYGYLQSLDALRVLWFVHHGLAEAGRKFDGSRIFACGGSGGGNVSLMANKLAPRTFTCIIDMCGMPKLSDDMAFGLPGGSEINSGYARDPADPHYLAPGHQELRYVGHPDHAKAMHNLNSTCTIVIVHGEQDMTCPYEDAREMAANLAAAGLIVEPHWIGPEDLDGTVFKSAGHPLGSRTEIVFRVAGDILATDGARAGHRSGPTDFERGEDIAYETTDGRFVISYVTGYPVGRFESR
jgi:predicted esterase